MEEDQTVYDFITSEEANFKAAKVEIVDGLEFSFYETVRTATLYKNSKVLTGNSDDKPIRNIILPMLRLQYRSEGFDVKDIDIYVDDPEKYYLSFLARKFHDKWARENGLDTFIDSVVECYVDYGAAFTKDTAGVKPDILKLSGIAFCDQTDMFGGPWCLKHSYSPDQLRREGAERGWNADSINTVITLSSFYKKDQAGSKQNKTPGKYIEVYELHGTLPQRWLDVNDESDANESDAEEAQDDELVGQLQIVTFYKDKNNKKGGITLFSGKETKDPLDGILRDPIYGRALGLGGAEELFEAQVWTTYDNIRMKGLLDAAAKMLYKTSDAAFANRNKTSDLENGEILVVADGKDISQLNTAAVNYPLFERAMSQWDDHAMRLAGSSPFLLGEAGGSHTAFRSIAAIINEAQALHAYRQGKLAVFFERLYRERFLPYIAREMAKGQTFLAELSLDELQEVAESLISCQVNDAIKEKILNGEVIDPQEIDTLKQTLREQFMKGGNKKFIEIAQNEFKNIPLDVKVSIKDKQQDFSNTVDKLTRVIGLVIQTGGQVLQDPTMAKLFNEMLQAMNLDPLDFAAYKAPAQQPQPNAQGQTPAPVTQAAAPAQSPASTLPVPAMATMSK